MAALIGPRRWVVVACALVGCGDLAGLKDVQGPVARVHLRVTGDLASVRLRETAGEPPRLHVALVWAQSWMQNEPYCTAGPLTPGEDTVVKAGCPDQLRFVPLRVDASVAVQPEQEATLDLTRLPDTEVMFGYTTFGVAYGSLVVFDDRDGSGTLELRQAGSPPATSRADVVYGASFISRKLPDRRLAYVRGDVGDLEFYPRHNCPSPPEGFSILSAGGYTPPYLGEDPVACGAAKLGEIEVEVALQAPTSVGHVACMPAGSSTNTVYSRPPDQPPALERHTWACSTLYAELQKIELVVASAPDDPCKGLTHYILRGCRGTPDCITAHWDLSAAPPAWWPCQEPER
jgi:hypothetical protein